MKISSKVKYAVEALLELASQQGEFTSVALLAERRNIPRTFLEQLLLKTKRHGLTASRRGPDGGYQLAREASDIRLGDIYAAVEGRLDLCACGRGKDDTRPTDSMLEGIWRELEGAIRTYLDGVTLEDLLSRGAEFPAALEHTYTFSI
ncbi:MAG: Rrf2 family transcriptional regulator [Candidatus Poribacteria bacterium]